MNFPLLSSADDLPKEGLSFFSSRFRALPSRKRQHFIADLALGMLDVYLAHDNSILRARVDCVSFQILLLQAIEAVRDIFLRIDLDKRYFDGQVKQKIASMFISLLDVVIIWHFFP